MNKEGIIFERYYKDVLTESAVLQLYILQISTLQYWLKYRYIIFIYSL